MSTESAEFVKKARTRLKLTQAEFAEKVGLERRSIVRYEQGGDLPLTVKLAIDQLVTLHKVKKRKNDRAKEGRERGLPPQV